MGRKLLLGLAAVACLGLAAPAQADPGGVKVGVLTCDVSSGWGFVFGSSKDLRCVYTSATNHTEDYAGSINKYGVDIGFQKGGVMVWAVFAPTSQLPHGALEGNYGGVTAGASAGVGAGANALIGGSGNTISLQPLSIEGSTGLNIAAGVASISLTSQP
jgi:hypothetical protein